MWKKGTQEEMKIFARERAERERYMRQRDEEAGKTPEEIQNEVISKTPEETQNEEAGRTPEETQIPAAPKEPPKTFSSTSPANTSD